MVFEHTPVMPQEVLLHQNLKPGDVCVDGTLGGCGHALKTIEAILPTGMLIGIDQDMDAIENAKQVLQPFKDNVLLFHRNFSDLRNILNTLKIDRVNSILIDLGFSLHQIEKSNRGFSFRKEEPLDMRMDTRTNQTAMSIISTFTESDLADLFYEYGEEKLSRRIARKIVQVRQISPIESSKQLADVVKSAVPAKIAFAKKIHPATQVFQALRIAVNKELDVLKMFMAQASSFLEKEGRISIISFHSLEDRIVKKALRQYEQGCTCPKDLPRCLCGFTPVMKPIFRKPILPTPEEIASNPMARSAKLRVAEKI